MDDTPTEVYTDGPTPTLPIEIVNRLEDALFKAFGAIPEPTPSPAINVTPIASFSPVDGSSFRAVNDAALANLGAWVPAIFSRAKSQPGTGAYRVTSRDLGRTLQEDLSLSPTGIIDFGIADMGDARQGRRTAIDIVMEWGNAPDALAARKWLAIQLGIQEPPPREVPIEVQEAAKGMTSPKSPKRPETNLFDAITLGKNADWKYPKGVMAEIVDWILLTSRRPNRPLAVAAATAVISTLCGRHLYSATGTAMNVYIACLAETAVGKDRPFSAVAEIFHACGLPKLQTTGKTFSVSGFENLIVDSPCVVASVDEIGTNLLAKISHKHASTHEAPIKGALQELWSRTKGKAPFMTTRRAQSAPTEVHSPSLTIFGASTPESFYETFTETNITDGFMNRFLIAQAAKRADAVNDVEMFPLPEVIKSCLEGIVPSLTGNLGSVMGVFTTVSKVDEVQLKWDCPETRAIANAFEQAILEIIDAKPFGYSLLGRVFEYSVRLAGIHAVSRAGRDTVVKLEDLEWGASWALESARTMMDAAGSLMSRNDYEDKINQIKRIIREAKQITHRDLLRKSYNINSRERKDILDHLSESEQIQIVEVRPEGGVGRPSRVIKWLV